MFHKVNRPKPRNTKTGNISLIILQTYFSTFKPIDLFLSSNLLWKNVMQKCKEILYAVPYHQCTSSELFDMMSILLLHAWDVVVVLFTYAWRENAYKKIWGRICMNIAFAYIHREHLRFFKVGFFFTLSVFWWNKSLPNLDRW